MPKLGNTLDEFALLKLQLTKNKYKKCHLANPHTLPLKQEIHLILTVFDANIGQNEKDNHCD
jgi:hypothetical protein